MQAQSSKANIVALATGGQDVINAIKQAAEFGIGASGQRLAATLLTVAEVHGLGLEAAQGSVLTESYYWDLNDRTRESASASSSVRANAKHGPGRHVFGDPAISQGSESRGVQGR